MNLSSLSTLPSTPPSSAPLKKRMAFHGSSNNLKKDKMPQRDNERAAAAAALASLSSKPNNNASTDVPAATAPSPPQRSSTNGCAAGYVSSSDSSTASSPLPRPVHAPPVNSMMVDHTYRDYSCVEETMLETLDAVSEGDSAVERELSVEERKVRDRKLRRIKSMFTDAGNVRKNSGGVTKPFPEKLMEVLSRGDIDTIIQWLPHGRAFIVLNPQVFVKEVLPRFFKQSKFMSFTRQLNLWGFKRITKGRDAGAYYHQLFLRGRPRLCMRMRRQKIKGTGIKLTPNPETEPDFYKISEAAPLPVVESKKEYEPLPPLRKVGNTASSTHASNVSSRTTSNGTTMGHPFEYASLLSGMDHHGRSNVNHPMHHSTLPTLPHRRVSAPASIGVNNLRMPPMSISSEGGRRLSNGSNGSSRSPMTRHMDLLSPSHDRSRAAAAATVMRTPSCFNAATAAAVSNSRGLLNDVRGLEMTTADQRLSAAQELEVLAQSLREKAAAEKQQQTIVSAQRLLNQMTDPRGPPSPRTIKQLKSHLLAAAHSLDTGSNANDPAMHAASRPSAGHYMPSNMSRRPAHSTIDPYNSLLQQQQQQNHRPIPSPHSADPLMNQIPNALMSALDQTKMVAAAAQEQSALLQRFAQNLEMRRNTEGGRHHPTSNGLYNPHRSSHM